MRSLADGKSESSTSDGSSHESIPLGKLGGIQLCLQAVWMNAMTGVEILGCVAKQVCEPARRSPPQHGASRDCQPNCLLQQSTVDDACEAAHGSDFNEELETFLFLTMSSCVQAISIFAHFSMDHSAVLKKNKHLVRQDDAIF